MAVMGEQGLVGRHFSPGAQGRGEAFMVHFIHLLDFSGDAGPGELLPLGGGEGIREDVAGGVEFQSGGRTRRGVGQLLRP